MFSSFTVCPRAARAACVALAFTVASVSLAGCRKEAGDDELRAACANYAALAMREFPGGDSLDVEGRAERTRLLTSHCVERLDSAEPLSSADAECVAKAETLEAIAVCRGAQQFVDESR